MRALLLTALLIGAAGVRPPSSVKEPIRIDLNHAVSSRELNRAQAVLQRHLPDCEKQARYLIRVMDKFEYKTTVADCMNSYLAEQKFSSGVRAVPNS